MNTKLLLFGIGRGFVSLFSLSAHNRIVKFCNALMNLRVRVGDQDNFQISDNNAVLTIARDSISEAATGRAILCSVTSATDDDDLTCEVLDGDMAGETITVSRPPLLKASVSSVTFDSITVSFTYANSQERTASSTGYITHTQRLLPNYEAGSEIYALATATGYIDLNVDKRAWVAIPYIPVP